MSGWELPSKEAGKIAKIDAETHEHIQMYTSEYTSTQTQRQTDTHTQTKTIMWDRKNSGWMERNSTEDAKSGLM